MPREAPVLQAPADRVNVGKFDNQRVSNAHRPPVPFNFPPSNTGHTGSNSDPTLERFYGMSRATPGRHISDDYAVHPMDRFYNDLDESPWNPERSLGPVGSGLPHANAVAVSTHLGPRNMSYGHYRSGPRSEVESTETGPYGQDSGYATGPATHSIASAEPNEYNQDCPDLSGQVDGIGLGSGGPPDAPGPKKYERQGPLRTRNPAQRRNHPMQCDRCFETLKCPSDYKYV